MISAMGRKARSRYGVAPAERVPAAVPPVRQVARTPKGHPLAQPRLPLIGRAPREHAAGRPPNPRKPKLVRDVGGGALKDLFALFPDLPRPRRPAGRVPARVARRPAKH